MTSERPLHERKWDVIRALFHFYSEAYRRHTGRQQIMRLDRACYKGYISANYRAEKMLCTNFYTFSPEDVAQDEADLPELMARLFTQKVEPFTPGKKILQDQFGDALKRGVMASNSTAFLLLTRLQPTSVVQPVGFSTAFDSHLVEYLQLVPYRVPPTLLAEIMNGGVPETPALAQLWLERYHSLLTTIMGTFMRDGFGGVFQSPLLNRVITNLGHLIVAAFHLYHPANWEKRATEHGFSFGPS